MWIRVCNCERAARLAGEHVSKTNAVLGITRVLSVEASRGEGYGISASNCLKKHMPRWWCLANWLAWQLTARRCLEEKTTGGEVSLSWG